MVIGHWTWTDTSIGPRSAEVRLQQPSAAKSPRGADRRGNSRIGHCGHGWVDGWIFSWKILIVPHYCENVLKVGEFEEILTEKRRISTHDYWWRRRQQNLLELPRAKENLHEHEGEVL